MSTIISILRCKTKQNNSNNNNNKKKTNYKELILLIYDSGHSYFN